MRKTYLEDIKLIVIILVVIMHCLQVYYPRLAHYVKGEEMWWIGVVFAIFEVWLMPLMFTVSGMSAAYSLRKRTIGKFAKSRVTGILIPLIFGLIFIVPLQSFPGRLWHTGTDIGYLEHWWLFFTGKTDMTGYAGGFGFSQYWFLLYLFVASMIYMAVHAVVKRLKPSRMTIPFPVLALPLLFLPITAAEPIGNVMEYSFGYYTAFMLIGGFILSDESMRKKLSSHIPFFITLAAATMLLYIWNLYSEWVGHYGGPIRYACALCCTLAVLAVAGRTERPQGKKRKTLSGISFGIYQFHQTGLSWSAYLTCGFIPFLPGVFIIYAASMLSGVFLTLLLSRFRVTRFMFGLKPTKKSTAG